MTLRFPTLAVFALLALLLAGGVALAEAPIDYPVAELGNCESESSCKAYCDELGNMEACLAFAEEHDLLPPDELEEAKRFVAIGAVGPGGCRDRDACEAYCEDVAHIDECLAFAEKHGFMPEEELEEAKQVARALKEGAQLPGGCRGKDDCRAYCEDVAHIDECLAFAEKAGFMPEKEIKEARAFAELMKRGETPGGCRGKESCEAFCSEESHFEECLAFAEKAGVVGSEDLERIKKTGGKGPGGCRGKEACEAFCNDPSNQEACFAFAKEYGLVPEEDLERIKEGVEHLKRGLEEAPPKVASCLKESLGGDITEKLSSGSFTPGPELAERVRSCFESTRGGFPGDRGEEEYETTGGMPQAIPEPVKACLTELVGGDVLDGLSRGASLPGNLKEAIEECTKKLRGREGGEDADTRRPDERRAESVPSSFAPDAASCLTDTFGPDAMKRLESGEIPRAAVDATLRPCLEEKGRRAYENIRPPESPETKPLERPVSPAETYTQPKLFVPPSTDTPPPEYLKEREGLEPTSSFLRGAAGLAGYIIGPFFEHSSQS